MPKLHKYPRQPKPELTPEADLLARPAKSARIALWVDYANSLGVDSTGTKDQIIERVG